MEDLEQSKEKQSTLVMEVQDKNKEILELKVYKINDLIEKSNKYRSRSKYSIVFTLKLELHERNKIGRYKYSILYSSI